MQQWEGRRNDPGRSEVKKTGLLQNWDCGDENKLYDAWGPVPRDACIFAINRLVDYGYAVNSQLMPVIATGVAAAFHYVGVIDPYAMYLLGLSDVVPSDSWCNCSYEINPWAMSWDDASEDERDSNGYEEFKYEPTPDELESYEYAPEQGAAAYRQMLASPGLKYLPYEIGERIRGLLHGELGYEDRYAQITADTFEALKDACSYQVNGEIKFDTVRMDAYFECAAWAAFVWIMSPLSLEFRCDAVELTHAVYRHGEAILVDPGYVYGSDRYFKQELPPMECYVSNCRLSAYCVTMTLVGDSFDYICEHCKSKGEDLYPPANCGSRVCKAVSCQHHPYNGMGKQLGTHEVLRKTGILLRQGDPLGRLIGKSGQDPLLLS
ncbi:MAG: hypothetical protein MUP21_13440 [Dehalococcoidia bacterium]|nr:hypothetical protein [Dehalococcoidia bacterium]